MQSKYGAGVRVPDGAEGTRLNYRMKSGYVKLTLEQMANRYVYLIEVPDLRLCCAVLLLIDCYYL